MTLKHVPLNLNRRNPKARSWLAKESNKEALREFLVAHGLVMEDVVEIDFTNQKFTVLITIRDEEGNKILAEDGYSVKVEERTFKYKTKIPTWA